jgi:hypothetical protein
MIHLSKLRSREYESPDLSVKCGTFHRRTMRAGVGTSQLGPVFFGLVQSCNAEKGGPQGQVRSDKELHVQAIAISDDNAGSPVLVLSL